MDGLGVGGGEDAHGASVEGAVEREDAEVGASGRLVDHARAYVLGGEVTPALLLPVQHEDGLVGVLVGARAARHGRDLVEALGRHPQQHVLQHRVPVGAGEHAQRGPVHNCFLYCNTKTTGILLLHQLGFIYYSEWKRMQYIYVISKKGSAKNCNNHRQKYASI